MRIKRASNRAARFSREKIFARILRSGFATPFPFPVFLNDTIRRQGEFGVFGAVGGDGPHDQAALHGLLRKLYDLGLPLLSVIYID